jgi:hypothetical protein
MAQNVMHTLDALSDSGRRSGTKADTGYGDYIVGTTLALGINVGGI